MADSNIKDIIFIVGKIAVIVFMIIHIIAIIILIRQATLASRVVETGSNGRVLLFSYLHAILLIVILLVIILLPTT